MYGWRLYILINSFISHFAPTTIPRYLSRNSDVEYQKKNKIE